MKANLIIEVKREAYSLEGVMNTMTVGELIDYLSQFDEESPVYISHDNGYTYGGLHYDSFSDSYPEDETEE